jgi:pyruvate kinase
MKQYRAYGRRTKIVCTIGPATGSIAMIERLIKAGMDVARLNLSHGTLSEHGQYIRAVRRLSQRLETKVAILLDLPGPKYRIGKLKGGQATLRKGTLVRLTAKEIEGDANRLPLTLPNLHKGVKLGDIVLIDDGAIKLRVHEIDGDEVVCRVTVGGLLTPGRGVVVPGMHISIPFVTDSLRQNLIFAIEQQPDYLALSFVTNAQNIADVKAILHGKQTDIPIIAKVEREEAVRDFDKILQTSDGIMVARGDLGVEIPLERVPMVQKDIIRKCNRVGKPVITATEMLESMVKSMRPTRAETTDVANAIFDGTDATMLSAETTIGEHPLQAMMMMDKIARETERRLPYELALAEKGSWFERRTEELISYSACLTAHGLRARTIVAFTQSGSTAVRVSKYRPRTIILAITPDDIICRRLVLYWGVHPLPVTKPSSISELFSTAANLSKSLGLAKPGDLIVITGGIPIGETGSTNLLKVEKVS